MSPNDGQMVALQQPTDYSVAHQRPITGPPALLVGNIDCSSNAKARGMTAIGPNLCT